MNTMIYPEDEQIMPDGHRRAEFPINDSNCYIGPHNEHLYVSSLNSNVRAIIASKSHNPVILHQLYNDPTSLIRDLVASNNYTARGTLWKIAREYYTDDCVWYLPRHPNGSQEICGILAATTSKLSVIQQVAKSHYTSPKLLLELAMYRKSPVAPEVAANKNCPPDGLKYLFDKYVSPIPITDDYNKEIVYGLISNEMLPTQLCQQIYEKVYSIPYFISNGVLNTICKHPNCPEAIKFVVAMEK